jgi:hypothetical protein
MISRYMFAEISNLNYENYAPHPAPLDFICHHLF